MESTSVPMKLASTDITIFNIIREVIGGAQLDDFSHVILIPEPLATFGDEHVSRAHLAMSLFLALYADLLDRVPHAREYFDKRRNNEETIFLDHGAVRTVDTPRNGDLPIGQEALTRILIPLGYFHNETYPLTKLRMTGRSYTHEDYADVIPQYFVSELHPEQVGDDNFEKAVVTVVEDSVDPLNQETIDDLAFIAKHGYLPRVRAASFLSNIASAFGRQHPTPLLSSYHELLKHSAEMAWIATEGNAFNHATDRVADVLALAENEKGEGTPIKDTVEISGTGRVLQTAYKADIVERHFRLDNDEIIEKEVPGSFFEFITRRSTDDGKVDLAFDANNATGIFAMTRNENGVIVDDFSDADIQED